MAPVQMVSTGAAVICVVASFLLLVSYLLHINDILKGVPEELRKLSSSPWTEEQLRKTYKRLEQSPVDYTDKLPPKLDRRYVITGGNGLVGGYIVLQLLARGTSPRAIRILDIRSPERRDLMTDKVSQIQYIHTDIRLKEAVAAAFDAPWDPSVAGLPMTVFHTAAVILASERSRYVYDLPEAVNVTGTKNVMEAAKAAGATVFSSTSSGSISIVPVNPWVAPWASEPANFFQVLDERDFERPLRAHEEFLGNYPASKAIAERVVCEADCEGFRTGSIRPAHGVYGNPTDNTVGGTLSKDVFPTWVPHITQPFVHAVNVALAHLNHEAALLHPPATPPSSGRPFVITDPNPPITYSDLYLTISTLSHHPFRTQLVPPILILLLSHAIEFYNLLPYRLPFLRTLLPSIKGETRYLQPALFSICTHLVAVDREARKGVTEGGIGYVGALTTMEGMVGEVLEWNREHAGDDGDDDDGGGEVNGGVRVGTKMGKRVYTSSNAWADQLRAAMGKKGLL